MRQPVAFLLTRRFLAGLFLLGVLTPAMAYLLYVNPHRDLPFHDHFAQGRLTDWEQFGGEWTTSGEIVENASDERGSKLVAGSPFWRDYVAETDVQLLGRGDGGLILRASEVEEGVDAYRGYYVGLRLDDNALVLGRADYGWQEFPPVRVPGGIATGHWYHLAVTVHGCILTAQVSDPTGGGSARSVVSDPDCPRSGRFGLRTMVGGGRFKAVSVRPFRASDAVHDSEARTVPVALYPTDQGLYTNTRGIWRPAGPPGSLENSPATISTIAQLRLLGISEPVRATVRGVITLTPSTAFIQDATGGAEIRLGAGNFAKSGDDVELSGDVHLDQLSLRIDHAEIRNILGEDSNPALSITPLQAAMGHYDAMFVGVEGTLVSTTGLAGAAASVELSGGGQAFEAVASSREIVDRLRQLHPGSVLRLRGTCLVGKDLTHKPIPFILLLRSPEDIEVLSGPPWWTANHLAELALAMLALGFMVHLLYSHSVEQRREAVLQERERLSHEMHDTLAQSFAGLDYKVRAIRNRALRTTGAIDVESFRSELTQTAEMIRHSHEEARRSLASLRPEILERMGLADALMRAGKQMTAGTPIAFEAQVSGQPRTISVRVADALFRIGQESLANAVRHSHASHIGLRLDYAGAEIRMTVQDDGIGFDLDHDSDGFGLTVMRRRAEKMRASLFIESDGHGTTVRVAAPCPRDSPWLLTVRALKSFLVR